MLLNLEHEVCDYNCMLNGLEDIYRNKTNAALPKYFFFALGGLCNFVYLNTNRSQAPKSVYWNDGRPKKMYEFMNDKIGYTYSFIENRTFKYSLNKLKEEINNGSPIVIGSLDMYYLEYLPKFYNQLHIPIHYVLAVGYDDEHGHIFLYDCSRDDLQRLSYDNLEKAWNVNVPGMSKRNTLHIFKFNKYVNEVKTIFYSAMEEKYKLNLYALVNFVGVKGILKLSNDILNWQKQLDKDTYIKCLLHIVEYAGFPPSLPVDFDIANHTGARTQFAALLSWAADEFEQKNFNAASLHFKTSGEYIKRLTAEFIDIAQCKTQLNKLHKDIITEIYAAESAGYKEIEKVFNLK